MKRIKAQRPQFGRVRIPIYEIILQIDTENVQTCLTCPLSDCVYFLRDRDIRRRQCPVWLKDTERTNEAKRRWLSKRKGRPVLAKGVPAGAVKLE